MTGGKVLLRGWPGVGKTTVARAVLERLPGARGFYTEELREGGLRRGFDIVLACGRRGPLARRGARKSHRVGSYGVFLEEFEALALPELEEGLRIGAPLVVDEVGKMELASAAFVELVREAAHSSCAMLATAMAGEHPFLAELAGVAEELWITRANRDELPDRILARLAVSPAGG